MSIALKSAIASAVFSVAGAAGAVAVDIDRNNTYGEFGGQFYPGASTLTFSDTFVSALNTFKATVDAPPGYWPQFIGTPGGYVGVAVSAPINGLTVETTDLSILKTHGEGGVKIGTPDATTFLCKTSAGATYNCGNGVATGGSVFVGNFTVDVVSKAIYGDVLGQSLALAADITNSKGVVQVAAKGAVTVNQVGIKLFDFDNVVGSTAVTSSFVMGDGRFWRLNYGFDVTGLALTTQAFNAISDSLGLYSIGRTALQGAAADFGVLSISSVPEPSTYALMVLGGVGLALVGRRRFR